MCCIDVFVSLLIFFAYRDGPSIAVTKRSGVGPADPNDGSLRHLWSFFGRGF